MKKIILLILTILLLSSIFIFSGQNGSKSISVSDAFALKVINKVSTITKKDLTEIRKKELVKKTRFIVRKIAHFTLYFTLGILIYLIISSYKLKRKVLYSLLICLILASLDEFHQLFSIGRTARVYDVFIDTIGSFTGILLTIIIIKIINKFCSIRQTKKAPKNN